VTSGIALSGITKRYPGVTALDDISFEARPGEIVAVVGENGAGKSTLVKILSGVIPSGAFDGTLTVDGVPARFGDPASAADGGIFLVPQELALHPTLSVAENILLGRLPGRTGLVDWKAAATAARRYCALVGLDVPVRRRVSSLSPGSRQLVAIARGLAREPRVLLLDEPTASLDRPEALRLLKVLDDLRELGASIVYVSHRIDEVLAVADRVVVLRNGRVVAERPVSETTERQLIAAMLGHEPARAELAPGSAPSTERPIALQVRGLSLPDLRRGAGRRLSNIDLEVRQGEIVGLVGLVGSGRTELLWSIFGALPRTGSVLVGGAVLDGDPRSAIHAGVGLLTEARHATGIFPLMSVAANLSIASLSSVRSLSPVRRLREVTLANRYIERLRIRSARPSGAITKLSGGNQQKVLIARWLARGSRVLLLDEPTRGVDIGAKEEIYRLIRDLATTEGLAVLVTSSEVSELVGRCDRYLIVRHGEIADEIGGVDVTESALLELAAGASERVAS